MGLACHRDRVCQCGNESVERRSTNGAQGTVTHKSCDVATGTQSRAGEGINCNDQTFKRVDTYVIRLLHCQRSAKTSLKVALTDFNERGIGVPLASFVSGYPDRFWFSSSLRSRGCASSSAARAGRSLRQFDVGQFARLVSAETRPSSTRYLYAFWALITVTGWPRTALATFQRVFRTYWGALNTL